MTNTRKNVGGTHLCWDGVGSSYWGSCTSLTELKINITNLTMNDNLWNKYMQLNPKTYFWKNSNWTQDIQLGFLAEEVEAIHPALAQYTDSVNETTNQTITELTGVKFDSITTANVMAIQNLYNRLKTMENETCSRDPTWSWC